MEQFFKRLRAANVSRQAEWPGNDKADILFRAIELGGECGELIEAMVMFSLGGPKEPIQKEAGDVMIALDLFCNEIGIDTEQKPTAYAYTNHEDLPGMVLLLQEAVKKYVRAQRGIAGGSGDDPLELVRRRVGDVGYSLKAVCRIRGIDLIAATTRKFNATSEKNGMATRLAM